MEASIRTFKRTVNEHGERIVKLETVVERLEADMREQTLILREVRDEIVGVRGAVRIGVGVLGAIGTLVGVAGAIVGIALS